MNIDQDFTAAFFSSSNQRKSPRARWLAFTKRYFDPVAIAFSALPILIVAFPSHPIASSASALGILVFALIGFSIERSTLPGLVERLPRLRWLWSFFGLGAVLVIYFLLLRGSPLAVAMSLWPLLISAMYFTLRLVNRIAFIPYIVILAGIFPLYSLGVSLAAPAQIDVGLSIANALWLLIVLAGIVAHVRTWDHYATRFETFRELVRWAGSLDARIEDVQGRLNMLGQSLRLERLTVLRIMRPAAPPGQVKPSVYGLTLPEGADPHAFRVPKHVEIIAKYIPGDKHAHAIKPWPLAHGLLAKAYRDRQAVTCPDTHTPLWREFFYNPPDAEAYQDTRAEFVQPIFESPDGEIIGFIDLQSRTPHSIHREEGDYLAALAGAIAPLLTAERLGNLLSAIQHLRDSLNKRDNEREVFDCIARFAIDILDVDVVTYFRLGFGNGWPLTPTWHMGAWFPDWLTTDLFRHPNPPPLFYISQWESVFERESFKNYHLLPPDYRAPPKEYFVTREQIASTVFLPIGTRTRRIGALFLNYRNPQSFSPATRLALEIFRQTISPHLENTRQLDQAHDGFGQVNLVLHDLVRDSIATHTAISPHLSRLGEAIEGEDCYAARVHFHKLAEPLQMHTDYVKTASLKFNLAAGKLLRNGMELALATANGVMEQRYAGRGMRVHVDPAVELLPADLHLALFSNVTEAAHNAVQSGRASFVNIGIYCQPKWVEAQITSDGDAWNPEAPSKPYSRHGIHSRLKLAEAFMRAEYAWTQEGRQLTLRIPILPHVNGKDVYGGA
ncbi:MAG: hypothetical protein HY868_25325 [Chloroflexi bacterium]|nr:hypothetical protein [Chloroflexota bacterium]